MSEYERCAEVCEEYGFDRQAALLRTVARGGIRVYAVCERASDGDYLSGEGGDPVTLFLDREEAERDAQRRDLLALRTRNLYEYCGGDVDYFSDLRDVELERAFSAIFGADFRLPDPDTHSGPLFPADATDEQMRAVLRLLQEHVFFHVAELEFAAGANRPASSESPS